MNINETEIMICDCGKTMPLDAKKIGAGCNSSDEPKVFTSLCTEQINFFEDALSTSSTNKNNLSIACTQQAKLFTDIAPQYKDRPGGYTRIIKMGITEGREEAVIELV